MRRKMLLLGAGASRDAGIPTTSEMTEKVVQLLKEDPQANYGATLGAIYFVSGAMIAHDSARGSDPFGGVDIERLFSAVEMLANRADLEVAPFVAAWHPRIDAFGDRTRWPTELSREIGNAIASRWRNDSGLERALRQAIRAEVGTVRSDRIYLNLMDRMTLALRKLVHVEDVARVAYLQPIVDLAHLQGELTVASLNYDLGIEMVARSAGLDVYTGIEQWSENGVWTWGNTGINLLKLHGSIDWSIVREQASATMPQRRVRLSSDPVNDKEQPAVVFGQRGKLRTEGPFLEMLNQFAEKLQSCDELVVVGYSFRDDHINEYLRTWLNGPQQRHIVVVDPGFPQPNQREDFRWELVAYLRGRPDPNGLPTRLTIVQENAQACLARVLTTEWRSEVPPAPQPPAVGA